MGKRLFDVAVGTVLGLLSLPVIGVMALGVCLSLRTGRPFFSQDRIGVAGRTFRILKMRTLPVHVPAYALKATLEDVGLPRFVAFLRRRHLDELPQLLLVPFGHLSLVGPRPKMPDDVEPVDPAYGSRRIRVAQGCTGLWQIGLRSAEQPDAAPEYDLFYLEHASLRLDLWIVWRTALLFLAIAGPVSVDDVPRWALRRHEPWVPAAPAVVDRAAN